MSTLTPKFESRRLKLKPFHDDENLWWLGKSPAVTEFLHALSILFPEGEAFFVRSVNCYAKDSRVLANPDLASEVKTFTAQEAQHAGEHSAYNKAIGKRYSHDQQRMTALVKWVLSIPENFSITGNIPVTCLAITCSLEHLTAILAELLLASNCGGSVICCMEPSHRYIWVWHAIEETEHKGVAYDVYQTVCGVYWRRCLAHVISTVIFVMVLVHIYWSYLWDAGLLFSFRAHADILNFLFLSPGFLPKLVPLWLEYFHPSFHPWTFRDIRQVIPVWNERLTSHSLSDIEEKDVFDCCLRPLDSTQAK